MAISEDKKIAAEKVMRFADQYLDGNIDNIVSFSLYKLRNDYEFGCQGRDFDSDDTELMRCIYVLIFSDLWPGLTLDALYKFEYRGETLNTCNTLFGSLYSPYNFTKSKHPGLDRYHPSAEFCQKLSDFKAGIYSSLGNMAVLPNRWLNGTTINRYRGCNHTHDFFDRFLVDLKSVLSGAEDVDENLLKLVNHNGIYLNPFMSADGFKKIIKGLFLEDYVDKEYNPIIVSKAYYYWMHRDGIHVTDDEYIAESNRHLDFSTMVIENRGRKMLDKLKFELTKNQ